MKEELVIVKDCEEALVKVNSKNGKYSIIVMILLMICYTCSGAFITNAFIFLEKDPDIKCSVDNSTFYVCDRKEACDINKNITYEFQYQKPHYSWTNDLRMECNDNFNIGLFGSLFYIGCMISSIPLADRFGRASLIKISMAFRSIILLIPLVYTNILSIQISLFFIGICNSLHSTIPYILLGELVSKENRDNYLTVMFMCESFSGIIGTLFFYFNQNWYLYLFLNVIYGLIFVIFSFMLYESPRHLYVNKRYEEAKQILSKIAKINLGVDMAFKFEKENQDATECKPQGRSMNLLSIIKKTRYRWYVIILPLIWFFVAFAFFAINFMVKYLNQNIYMLNTILFLAEFVSYLISRIIMYIFGKRNTMMGAFLISAVSFFVFYFVGDSNIYFVFILTFLAKFGASIVLNVSSIYTTESFPTGLRGSSVALCSIIGKFGGILAPLIVELSDFAFLISGVFCLFSAVILIPLANSNNKVEFNDEHELSRTFHNQEIPVKTTIELNTNPTEPTESPKSNDIEYVGIS